MKKQIIVMATLIIGWGSDTSWASTSINSDNQYAYGANIGWLNLRGNVDDGASIGRFFSDGYIWSPNVGWISLGSGTPANGWSYANNSATDWGVNHDEEGNLSGYAYGANIGWLNFGHGQTAYEPRIDLSSGILSGYIWGANVGWISLSNSQAFVQTDYLESGPDGSVAGVPAAWEAKMGTALDGLTSEEVQQFYVWGLDPTEPGNVQVTSIGQPSSSNLRVAWNVSALRQYQLEYSIDLLDNAGWEAQGNVLSPSIDTEMGLNMPLGSFTNRFFRVRAIVPLSP